MYHYLTKCISIFKAKGFSALIGRLYTHVIWLYAQKFDDESRVYHYRVKLSELVDELFKSTVGYGPFKGLVLTNNRQGQMTWSFGSRAATLLGIYEQEVLNMLSEMSSRKRNFIDIGAADGYYAVGCLVNNLYENAICYEISNDARKVIEINARNNLVENRITIRGEAKKDFYLEIDSSILWDSVILIDIEGGEFDLLDANAFRYLKNSVIIIELHDWFFQNGRELKEKLLSAAEVTHDIKQVQTSTRDLSKFVELEGMNDTDRWLICSEGRGQLMTWLRLTPK